MAATQVDIARELNIDVSTVNKILNHARGPVFTKETIRRVLRKAKELDYKPSSSSKGQMRSTLETLFPLDGDMARLAEQRGVTMSEVNRIRKMLYGDPDFKL